MTSRRQFIQSALATVAITGLNTNIVARNSKESTKLTILHTNDWHSRIEPFPLDGGKYQGMGGAERRKILLDKLRKQEKNVLLLDAGDIFQGTPYFNLYQGELEIKLMNEMKYDAVAIGNHEFDAGMDKLADAMHAAQFNYLCANYDAENTVLHGKFRCNKIIIFQDIKIGIFGIGIDTKGLIDNKVCEGIKYKDPYIVANHQAHILKQSLKCDYVICLSHLGLEYNDSKASDILLAQRSRNIDLIIGGHTHTFMDIPICKTNRDNKQVIISQAGWAGIKLGRIDLIFNKKILSKKTFYKFENLG